jgi:hypothetical protein
MKFDEFKRLLHKEHMDGISKEDLKLIYEEILEKAKLKAKEDAHKKEKSERKRVEHFYSLLKRVEPPITKTTKWEEVCHLFPY